MEVLRRILDGSLSRDQQKRGRAKLAANYPPYNVERNRLNNADRNIYQQVYDNEKKGVAMYNSTEPIVSPVDKGKLYKIEAFMNPFMGSLRGKIALGQQQIAQIEAARAQIEREEGGAISDILFTPKALTNNFFGTKDVTIEFNQLMNYIKTYVQDILNQNTDLALKVQDSLMVPAAQVLDQVLTSYANFWNSLPEAQSRQAQSIKNSIRKLIEKCYTLFSVMFELIRDGQYRPLTDNDLERYKQANNVYDQILTNFPNRQVPKPIAPPAAPAPPVEVEKILPPAPPAPTPISRVQAIIDPAEAALQAIGDPPATLVNTDRQPISKKDYFLLVSYVWLSRLEDAFMTQTMQPLERDLKQAKIDKERLTKQARAARKARQADIADRIEAQIEDLDREIARLEPLFQAENVKKISLFKSIEALNDYLREVAKIPTNDQGKIKKSELRKVRADDVRDISNVEQAIKTSIGLQGFGKPKKLLGSKIDNMDDGEFKFPWEDNEFDLKRNLALKARGDRRVVLPDQSLSSRMKMFDPMAEFNPQWELLKKGYKANDTVMEPDAPLMVIQPNQFEASGLPEDENDTAFKKRFSGFYAQHAKRTDDRPIQVEHKTPFGGFFDIDGNDNFTSVKEFESIFNPVEHYKVEEEPDDILEHPDELRKKIDAYKFNTGKMKNKPKYLEVK